MRLPIVAAVFCLFWAFSAQAEQKRVCAYDENYQLVCGDAEPLSDKVQPVENAAELDRRAVKKRFREGRSVRFYNTARGGYSVDAKANVDAGSVDFDNGPMGAIGAGVPLPGLWGVQNMAAEVELFVANNELEQCVSGTGCVTLDQNMAALLFGVTWRPSIASFVDGYLGAAIGPAVLEFDAAVTGAGSDSESEWGGAGTARAGVDLKLLPRLNAEVGYRYFTTTEIEDVRSEVHGPEVGLRVNFN